jgi:exodeoxyribonuclease VII small subunit
MQESSSGSPSFEQTLARLEEIVHLLEDGKIGLDAALGCYEEGVGLLRKAYEMLERAERKISLLTGVDSEGNPVLRPMEDAASFSPAREASGPTPAAGSERNAVQRGRRGSDFGTG